MVRQDVQRKVHEEIDRVLGKELLPRIVYKNRYKNLIIAWRTINNISFANCCANITTVTFQIAILKCDDSGSNEIGERRSYFNPTSGDG